MRYVITGGGGFIGRATVTALKELGHETAVFDLRHGGDIRDFTSVEAALRGFDGVVHLAGVLGTHELFDSPQLAIDSNVTGTLNVLEACKQFDMAYCGITMPQVFPSIYTATKVAATRLASAYHRTYGFPVSHVRAFNAFGPGQAHGPGHPQKIIPTFAVQAYRGEPIPIWGNGKQGVDLIHTRDLANLLAFAVTTLADDAVLDGGTGQCFSVLEVAMMVAWIAGVNPLIEFLPMRRGEQPTWIKAEGEGWEFLPPGQIPAFRESDLQEAVESYKGFA